VTEKSRVALLAHAPKAVDVYLKSVCNEGQFILAFKRVFRPCLASHWNVVIETSHLTLSNHDLLAVNVCSTWVSNYGHFTREVKRVFRHYLALHASR
jgi:hypothetical protein